MFWVIFRIRHLLKLRFSAGLDKNHLPKATRLRGPQSGTGCQTHSNTAPTVGTSGSLTLSGVKSKCSSSMFSPDNTMAVYQSSTALLLTCSALPHQKQ